MLIIEIDRQVWLTKNTFNFNEVVVQDAIAYQKLLDRLEYAESVAAIRQGIEECDRVEAKPAKEALEELRAKHGKSRRS